MNFFVIPLRPLRSLRELFLFHAKLAKHAKNGKVGAVIASLLLAVAGGSAQMARKPSPTREPAGFVATSKSDKNSLPKIATQADFDSLARTYHQGTPYALPHVMFAID